MANRPMSKPITPLRGLTPTLFSCPRPLPGPRPGSLPVCRATAWRPNGFPGAPGSAQRVGDVVGTGRCGDGGTPGVTGGVVVGVGVGLGVGVGRWSGAWSSGPGPSGQGSSVGPVGVGVPSSGRGDGVTTAGAAVAAGTGATRPVVPGTEVPGGVVVGPGDGGRLGPVVDRMGTVAPGPWVGDVPRVPIRAVGTPTDAGAGGVEPVGSAGSAGPPTTTVRRVTATQPPTCDAERLEGVTRCARPFSGTVARGPYSHGRTLDPPGGCVSGARASSPGRAASAPTDARNDAFRRRPRHILRRSARPGAPVRHPVPTPRSDRPRPPAWRSSRRW